MMKCLRIKMFSKLFTLFSFVCLLFMSSSAFALVKTDNQKAMDAAEKQTNGKAIGAKFLQKGEKKGYKVRIFKEGKVSHVFIPIN